MNSIRGLRQELVPIDDLQAPMDMPGFLSRSSVARRCAYIGLWVLAVGLVLAMTGTPALSLATRAALQELGRAGLLFGVVLELLAFIVSRIHRDRMLVELQPAAAGAATNDVALRDLAPPRPYILASEGSVLAPSRALTGR